MSGLFKKDIWREGNLSNERDGWDEIEEEETRLLRLMTVEESLDPYRYPFCSR